MAEFKYVGSELDLFATVHNWKSYWSDQLRPYIAGDTLEVGAGIGSNTAFLDRGESERWVCLEPDGQLFSQLVDNLAQAKTQRPRETVCGTLAALSGEQKFDTILYIDVLEHIENDRQELETAADFLRPGGRVIVLSPAHQRLFTPFDGAIGHFRRYDRGMLEGISPRGLRRESVFYLDSAGLLLSTANLVLLRQSMPTKAQLQVWDRWVIPVSRVMDRVFFHSVGKSIVGVWRRAEAAGGD